MKVQLRWVITGMVLLSWAGGQMSHYCQLTAAEALLLTTTSRRGRVRMDTLKEDTDGDTSQNLQQIRKTKQEQSHRR